MDRIRFLLTSASVVVLMIWLGVRPAFPAEPDPADTFPKRVVSLSPIITETIFLVGAGDRLIADTTYCNVPPEARDKIRIGSVTRMDVEKIAALRPDLVIASALSREKQLVTLEKLAIPVIRTPNPKTFEQMCDTTLAIGRRLGHEAQACDVVGRARQKAAAVLAMTGPLPKPSVFLQIGIKPLHSANQEMFINEYIRYCGGRNIVEAEKSGVFSREKVVDLDPDIILIATMGSSKKAGAGEREKWRAYPALKAVKADRIHVLDPELICSPTPDTFVTGLFTILPLIHPELASRPVQKASETGGRP